MGGAPTPKWYCTKTVLTNSHIVQLALSLLLVDAPCVCVRALFVVVFVEWVEPPFHTFTYANGLGDGPRVQVILNLHRLPDPASQDRAAHGRIPAPSQVPAREASRVTPPSPAALQRLGFLGCS